MDSDCLGEHSLSIFFLLANGIIAAQVVNPVYQWQKEWNTVLFEDKPTRSAETDLYELFCNEYRWRISVYRLL